MELQSSISSPISMVSFICDERDQLNFSLCRCLLAFDHATFKKESYFIISMPWKKLEILSHAINLPTCIGNICRLKRLWSETLWSMRANSIAQNASRLSLIMLMPWRSLKLSIGFEFKPIICVESTPDGLQIRHNIEKGVVTKCLGWTE